MKTDMFLRSSHMNVLYEGGGNRQKLETLQIFHFKSTNKFTEIHV
jgi:hypothetical protein